MPQFTKGRWAIHCNTEKSIIGIFSEDNEPIQLTESNARLIAEAPTMYDLLNQAFEALPDDHPLRYDIDACLCHVEGTPVPSEEDESTERNENSAMTLDEAIQHALDIAENHGACAENHKQLAAWLTELKNLKQRKL